MSNILGIHNTLDTKRVNQEYSDYFSLFGTYSFTFQLLIASIGNKEKTTEENVQKRSENYGKMVVNFYDLVTDFYEYGWGKFSLKKNTNINSKR